MDIISNTPYELHNDGALQYHICRASLGRISFTRYKVPMPIMIYGPG